MKETYGKIVNELNVGHFLVSKIQWLYATVIVLKLWNAPGWLYAVVIVVTLPFTWLIGWLMVRSGLWRDFMRNQLKGAVKQ